MTKTYIVPCVMKVDDPVDGKNQGFVHVQIGSWRFCEDAPDILDAVNLDIDGVEIDFDKMQQLAKQSDKKFDEDKFLKDFTDTVRDALNEIVNGEPR